MRQTNTLGTWPDVNTSCALPVASTVEAPQYQEHEFVLHDDKYLCVYSMNVKILKLKYFNTFNIMPCICYIYLIIYVHPYGTKK